MNSQNENETRNEIDVNLEKKEPLYNQKNILSVNLNGSYGSPVKVLPTSTEKPNITKNASFLDKLKNKMSNK